MVHDEGRSGKSSPNGKPGKLLASSPSAHGNGKAHANGSTRKADEPNPHAIDVEPHANGKPARRKLDYPFDAMPVEVLPLVREGDLEFSDIAVLLAIIQKRKGSSDEPTCWATNRRLGQDTGLAERSIPNSIHRLTKCRLIQREACGKPDPQDKKNRTGYRFRLMFSCVEGRSQTTLDIRSGSLTNEGRSQTTQFQMELNTEFNQMEKSSSSSFVSPSLCAGDDDDVRFASKKSGGSKLIPVDEGLELLCAVAGKLANLPGLVDTIRAATDLPLHCGHDWRFLAAVFVRLDAKVATREARPKDPVAYALGKMFKEMRSKKFPAAKLAALYADVDRFLAPAPPPVQRRKDSGPDHATKIAALELDLVGLEADVATAPNQTAKRCARRALDRAREELTALKSDHQHGDVQSRLAVPATH